MSGTRKILGRRSFLGGAGAAITAAAMPLSKPGNANAQSKGGKLKVALVGTGIRGSETWGKTVNDNYSDIIEFVGLCDINAKRMAFAKEHIGAECRTFTDFDEMVKKTSPDTVIVTTMDCFHAKYICRAMELGCDVITEKPMATDEKMCQAIIDTERRTGRHVRVTFNYRYNPAAERTKELLMAGEIGHVTSVDFTYFLNTSHGASYFRRWHGFKQNSGSLLVHKSTHHFDLLNWWLDAEPMEVNAHGSLRHYGHNSPFRGKRCMSCQHKGSCPYFWDITSNDFLMNLYVNCESDDGYIRDACLYRDNNPPHSATEYHGQVIVPFAMTAVAINPEEDPWGDEPWDIIPGNETPCQEIVP